MIEPAKKIGLGVLITILTCTIFMAGYFVHKYRIQHLIYKSILELSTNDSTDLESINTTSEAITLKKILEKYENGNGLTIRGELKNKISTEKIKTIQLIGEDLKTFSRSKKVGGSAVIYKASDYGVNSYGVLHAANNNTQKRLIIFSRGHDAEAMYSSTEYKFIKKINASGIDLFTIDMISRGFNSGLSNFPSGQRVVSTLPNTDHIIYSLFYDPKDPNRLPVSLFINGNYNLIRDIIKTHKYNDVRIIGTSGGGWASLFLSAIIPEISHSTTVSSDVPIFLRSIIKNTGDYEQIADPIYRDFDYWDLYILSTLDTYGNVTRTHQSIYNSYDPCCFNGESAEAMIKVLKKIDIKNYSLKINRKFTHGISMTDFDINN